MTTIDRRQALGFATGAAATLAVPAGARRVSNGRFLWGAATAGYQIEGNAPPKGCVFSLSRVVVIPCNDSAAET